VGNTYIKVLAFLESTKSITDEGPTIAGRRVPPRTYSKSWALKRAPFSLELKYALMAMIALLC
jgi:hypothetical protein